MDVHLHLITVDVLEELRFCAHDLIILASLDGVFSKDLDSLLITLQLGFPSGFLGILLVFEWVLQFEVDLVEAGLIATFVIDQDVPIGTLSANIPSNVLLATEDIHKADTLIQVVVVVALEANSLIAALFVEGPTSRQVHLGMRHRGQQEKDKGEQQQ